MGCPCSKDCCDNPSVGTPEHDCNDDFCEECWAMECDSCGEKCYCEV